IVFQYDLLYTVAFQSLLQTQSFNRFLTQISEYVNAKTLDRIQVLHTKIMTTSNTTTTLEEMDQYKRELYGILLLDQQIYKKSSLQRMSEQQLRAIIEQ